MAILHGSQSAEQVVHQELLPACALACCSVVCGARCVLCAGVECPTLGGWSVPHASLLFQKPVTWLRVELPDFFFLGCFISTSLSAVFPLYFEHYRSPGALHEILKIPHVVGPVPEQPCVKSSLRGRLAVVSPGTLQMFVQLSQALEVTRRLLKAHGGVRLSSALCRADWAQLCSRGSTTDLSLPETSQLCPGLLDLVARSPLQGPPVVGDAIGNVQPITPPVMLLSSTGAIQS